MLDELVLRLALVAFCVFRLSVQEMLECAHPSSAYHIRGRFDDRSAQNLLVGHPLVVTSSFDAAFCPPSPSSITESSGAGSSSSSGTSSSAENVVPSVGLLFCGSGESCATTTTTTTCTTVALDNSNSSQHPVSLAAHLSHLVVVVPAIALATTSPSSSSSPPSPSLLTTSSSSSSSVPIGHSSLSSILSSARRHPQIVLFVVRDARLLPTNASALTNCTIVEDVVNALEAASSASSSASSALHSFSRTSVLLVSIAFVVLMVISLAWLLFYYVQRFRYAHAKDRLHRRLFNAARKALSRIPTRQLQSYDTELDSDCPVCIDQYGVGDLVRQLPCRHVFHKTCIDPWLLEHRTCPMCKADILKQVGYYQLAADHQPVTGGGTNTAATTTTMASVSTQHPVRLTIDASTSSDSTADLMMVVRPHPINPANRSSSSSSGHQHITTTAVVERPPPPPSGPSSSSCQQPSPNQAHHHPAPPCRVVTLVRPVVVVVPNSGNSGDRRTRSQSVDQSNCNDDNAASSSSSAPSSSRTGSLPTTVA